MPNLRSTRKGLKQPQLSFGIFLLGSLLLSSHSWAQCTSCDSCPPPVIGFTSKQMTVTGNQALSASGGMGPYSWVKVGGGGNLSGSSGPSVTFTAPTSNADCTANPTIELSDSCGRTTSLNLAINGYGSSDWAYRLVTQESGGPASFGIVYHLYYADYTCAGAWKGIHGNCDSCTYACCGGVIPCVTYARLFYDGGCEVDCTLAGEIARCENSSACEGDCTPRAIDKRNPDMIANGCCPASVTSCLYITRFNADISNVNLSGGKQAKFTGSLSSRSGAPISWTITVAGKTLPGSGSSISASWDGTDDSGKQVAPGNYTAILNARTDGGSCNDSDLRSVPITVTATQPMAKTWPACVVNPEVAGDSAVNLTSGNLSHSQPLFTLPNSKFLGEFSLSYNSLSSQNDVLGMGWTHTYNIRLVANNDGSYTIIEGDGERTTLYNKGSYFSPQNSNYPALTVNGNGTFTFQHKDGITYSFDSDKKITAISDRNANTIGFAYTGNNLTTVTDPSGRNVVLAFSGNKIDTITDPRGNIHTFSYTGQNLTGISSQIAGVGTSGWSYTYYDNSFMHTKTDPLNNTTTYYYDGDHRLAQSTDPENKNRSFVYTPSQLVTQMVEKDGGFGNSSIIPSWES